MESTKNKEILDGIKNLLFDSLTKNQKEKLTEAFTKKQPALLGGRADSITNVKIVIKTGGGIEVI
jgi:hypothetical protein